MGQCQIVSAERGKYETAERFLPEKAKALLWTTAVQPHFIGKTDNFWYSWTTVEGTEYYYFDARKKKVSKLFDRQVMAAELSRLTSKKYDEKQLELKLKFDEGGKSFAVQAGNVDLYYDLQTGHFSTAPFKMSREDSLKRVNMTQYMLRKSRDGKYVLYALKHNLWIEGQKDDTLKKALTTDGVEYFSYSTDERDNSERKSLPVAQWIGGTHKWYALRLDNRKRSMVPLVQTLKGRPKLVEHPTYYPGDAEAAQYDLVIGEEGSDRLVRVDLTRWQDQKVTVLEGSPDGKKLFVERKKRTCDELEVCEVNTETGELRVLFGEECKPYFNEQQHSIAFLNGGEEIIWWSERTGKGHYYLLDANGKEKHVLTKGDWIAGKIVKIDTVGRQLYIQGYAKEKGVNPYYALIYAADLNGKKALRLLTPEDATHEVVFSPSGKYLIDNYSRVDLTPESVLRESNGRKVCNLGTADLSRLYGAGWKMPERFTVKAADSVTDLYGVMWKPFDFDSTRRYPIISYVYPGPQSEAMDIAFTPSGDHNAALAQMGFIVVNMGHRGGSPLRDRVYRTYGYNNLRDYPLADDKYGLEQLADRYDFIDLDRVGIFGHSGGGSMSAAAICTYPDFYKVAVSSAGNHNNNIYNRWWTESHHGVKEIAVRDKEGNVTGVKFESLVPTNMELVKNLKGHLLLMAGDADDNVHPAQTLQMVDALVKAGKDFDMYILPGQGHFYKGEYDTFFRRKVWQYFSIHL